MILDEAAKIADGTVADGTKSEAFEVGPPPDRFGPGQPILCYMTGKNLAGAGPYRLIIWGDAAIDGNFTIEDMSITIGPQAAEEAGVVFALPSNISNFVKASLSGFTGGTFEVWAGVMSHGGAA